MSLSIVTFAGRFELKDRPFKDFLVPLLNIVTINKYVVMTIYLNCCNWKKYLCSSLCVFKTYNFDELERQTPFENYLE